MPDFHTHAWEPLTDLPADWSTSLANPNVTSLVKAWQD